MTLEIIQTPCLSDNYAYLCHDNDSKMTASIDTPDADTIMSVLSEKGWQLTHILNTHHHYDHTDGNLQLKAETGCQIIAAAGDRERIPGIDQVVVEGDLIHLGDYPIQVYETPGHTTGHIVYRFVDQPIAFVGDTLFSLGCGRLFEGSAAQMWASLSKIMQWPDDTQLYCAHEYTQSNAEFALSLETKNIDLNKRHAEILNLRQQGKATVPTTLGLEKKTNPFLRVESIEIQSRVGQVGQPAAEVFAAIRAMKDRY